MSAAFNYDMSRYIWGKSMRGDTARVTLTSPVQAPQLHSQAFNSVVSTRNS